MNNQKSSDDGVRLEIRGLTRTGAEALVLELRQLAKRHAIDIEALRLELAPDGAEESSA